MFIEERLLDCVSYGTTSGPTFLTRRVPLRSGIVRRNPLRSRPLHRFIIVYRNLLPEHHEEVLNAFNACFGGAFSFRAKDWKDYTAEDQLMSALGTGAEQTLQLRKLYTFGTQTVARPIRKPVVDTVEMTANGAPLAATIDYTTGMATYTAANGATVRWSGEFDVPVMFEDDEWLSSIDDKNPGEGFFITTDVALTEDFSV